MCLKLFYFLSYEIVNQVFADPFKPDNRHLKDEYVNKIMELFKKISVSLSKDNYNNKVKL